MKINYLNKKFISLLLSGTIVLSMCGCTKKNNSDVLETYTKIEEIKDTKEETIKESTLPVYESSKTECIYSKEDLKIINEFNNIYNNINETNQNFKENCKATFINIIDFIFYDKEINGIKFRDLTNEGKEKVLEICHNIDIKMEVKYPNYKEKISDSSKNAFNKASELIKKGINNLDEISKAKLGIDNYNEIIKAKNEFLSNLNKAVDVGKNLYDDGKEYVKNWYKNFKSK